MVDKIINMVARKQRADFGEEVTVIYGLGESGTLYELIPVKFGWEWEYVADPPMYEA